MWKPIRQKNGLPNPLGVTQSVVARKGRFRSCPSHDAQRHPIEQIRTHSHYQAFTIFHARPSLVLRAAVALSPSPCCRGVTLSSSTRKLTAFVRIMSKLTQDQVKSPVPSDIEVSQSLEGSLPHIAKIAEAIGVLDSEMEPYGRYKGKVRQDNTVHSIVVNCCPCNRDERCTYAICPVGEF